MNDEETVALIAGGHTFGKTHGAADPEAYVGPEPEAAPLEEQGLGWQNAYGSGVNGDTITSGLEGTWTDTPTAWDNSFFEILFGYEWELVKSPAGAWQWRPQDCGGEGTVPDAHDPARTHQPTMLTTDLSLRFDPAYEKISRRFASDPDAFADAFARAWFKLTHRDMGPITRYLGPEVPDEVLVWQDPVPAVDHGLVGEAEVDELKRKVLDSGLDVSDLVFTAWSSAASFRGSDKRGGANGARIRLEPQKDWEVNDPERTARVIAKLENIREQFNGSRTDDIRISLADLIVLAGGAAVEMAAAEAGRAIAVPFTPGRTDASQEQTDVDSFSEMEVTADGFRNYISADRGFPAEYLLLDRANLLNLSAPEMTVLVGGLRVLGANHGNSDHGVLTDRPGTLTNDFFVNLLSLETNWKPDPNDADAYVAGDRDGNVRWRGSRADLVFGSNSELRALAEVYASDDASEKFVDDFVTAWTKVMELDRFDLD
jgi:catalase-peroxidase